MFFHTNNRVIDRIQFDVLSAEDILQSSVVEITTTKLNGNGSVYDEKMGPTVVTKDQCITCGLSGKNCAGHFGHITLAYPIFHPLFETELISLLRSMCFSCNRLFCGSDNLVTQTGGTKSSRSGDKCSYCGVKQPIWECDDSQNQADVFYSIFMNFSEDKPKVECTAKDVQHMLNRIPEEDILKWKYAVQPKNLIITVLPVLPPSTRPVVMLEEKFCDDDLTVQYIEILKINNIIRQKLTEITPMELEKHLKVLYFRVSSLFNNSSGKSKHNTNGKPIKSIKERLSSKEGVMRGNLMGKRTEQSGRTVIGPDPTLKMDEIAIPEEFANTLTIPVRVTELNYRWISEIVNQGGAKFIKRTNGNEINLQYALYTRGTRLKPGDIIIRDGKEIIWDKNGNLSPQDYLIRDGFLVEVEKNKKKTVHLEVGDIVERCLRNGDYVILNRQPTLHFGSMIAQKVKIIKGKTLRFNLCITKSLNADFDGDEGNVHVAQKPNSIVELQELSSVSEHIINQKNGEANTVLVQDNLTSLYLMSVECTPVSREDLFQMTMDLVDQDGNEMSMLEISSRIRGIEKIAGTLASDKLISLCLPEDLDLEHEDCIIQGGIWLQGVFNKKLMNKLIKTVYHTRGAKQTQKMINNLEYLSNKWLYGRGFSIGLEDCMTNSTAGDLIPKTILRCFTEANHLKQQIYHDGIREVRIQGSLNKARDVGLRIAKEGLHPQNNFLATVNSGSKGDFFNIAQIAGLLGQQNFRGKRINCTLNHGLRSLYHYSFDLSCDKDVYESRGFIRHSFLRGLNPREIYFHALPGREGITDTALGTGSTGYMQRRLIKLMEDLHIANDGTVRDDLGKIFQFYYGTRGLDTTGVADIEDIASMVNRRYETTKPELNPTEWTMSNVCGFPGYPGPNR